MTGGAGQVRPPHGDCRSPGRGTTLGVLREAAGRGDDPLLIKQCTATGPPVHGDLGDKAVAPVRGGCTAGNGISRKNREQCGGKNGSCHENGPRWPEMTHEKLTPRCWEGR